MTSEEGVVWQRYAAVGALLALITFALASVHIDLDMGVGMSLSLMDITLHPCARFFRFPWQFVCFVIPIAIAEVLWGYSLMIPCLIVVRLVCVWSVSRIYHGLPEIERDGSILPFLAHGFWLLLGVGLYDALVFGLVRFISGVLVAIVEWVVAGGISLLLMRLLNNTILYSNDREAMR